MCRLLDEQAARQAETMFFHFSEFLIQIFGNPHT
jgi:hypothetical protein